MLIVFVPDKCSRTDFHERNATAMIGIHIGMYLENES